MTEKLTGLPVHGYRAQTEESVLIVNVLKATEEKLLRALDDLAERDDVDQAWLAAGRQQIEQGFMAVNRSVFRPGRVRLPGDPE